MSTHDDAQSSRREQRKLRKEWISSELSER